MLEIIGMGIMKNRTRFMYGSLLCLLCLVSLQMSCSPEEVDDPGSGGDALPIVTVNVPPPEERNPLARVLEVTSDRACSLSGFVTTAGEPGRGLSDPAATEMGTQHRIWFYGLLEERTFRYTIHLAGRPADVVATGEFLAPPLPEWVPDPIDVGSTPQADESMWVAMSINTVSHGLPGVSNVGLILVTDRQGRYRFFHSTERYVEEGQFLEGLIRLSNGDLAWTNRHNLVTVRPDGTERLLFDVRLDPPFDTPIHHTAYVFPEGNEALVLFNLFGQGVECDLVTPTDKSIGDGVALLGADGREIRRWTVFQSQEEIPPELLNTCIECWWGFWEFKTFDYSHANSVGAVDGGDAFIVSLRNLSRIVKVEAETGEVLWVMGDGCDFTWLGNEPEVDRWFDFQHDATWLEPNRLLIFDNGRGRQTPCEMGDWSRAMELEVDEEAMTVELVWEHRVMYGHANGNAERLPSGNTLISGGWNHRVVEATPEGDEVWHFQFLNFLGFPNLSTSVSYPATWEYR